MPDSRQFRAVLTGSDEHGWNVTVTDVGHVNIDDPSGPTSRHLSSSDSA
jgi:hypothetical protein